MKDASDVGTKCEFCSDSGKTPGMPVIRGNRLVLRQQQRITAAKSGFLIDEIHRYPTQDHHKNSLGFGYLREFRAFYAGFWPKFAVFANNGHYAEIRRLLRAP